MDADIRKAICGCVAVGCGLPAGGLALEGISSSQQGATITLSLPAHKLPPASREASAAKVMVAVDRRLQSLAS